jgi:UDP-glucose 4-epimerase
MKRILVTGAGGFIGANLARRLLREGHQVHLLVSDSSAHWRLAEISAHVQLHASDIGDRNRLRTMVSVVKPEWIFHLAAYGAYSWQKHEDRMVKTNLQGCMSLFDACVEVGFEAFVHSGSSSEYGFKDHAAREEELVQPNSVYAVTKAAATHYCQLKARQLNVHAVTARLYSIYGPFEEPARLVPTLLLYGLRGQIPPLAQPEIARDFVYIDDAVEALLRLAAAPGVPRGSVYNVCAGVQSTLGGTVDVVRSLLGITAEPKWSTMEARTWDTGVWLGCPAAAQRDLDWSAGTSLRVGFQRTLQWFRENPSHLQFYSSRIFGASSPD